MLRLRLSANIQYLKKCFTEEYLKIAYLFDHHWFIAEGDDDRGLRLNGSNRFGDDDCWQAYRFKNELLAGDVCGRFGSGHFDQDLLGWLVLLLDVPYNFLDDDLLDGFGSEGHFRSGNDNDSLSVRRAFGNFADSLVQVVKVGT